MLSTCALTRRFGTRVAVENLTLQVGRGEIFVLLGPNGAGKTTTLRMLAGLIAPSSGTAHVDGIALDRKTAHAVRGRIGLLTETPGLWDRLSVWSNLLVYARLYDLKAPQDAVAESLERFGLSDRADTPAAELSKGMKQKVALARALIHNPPVVLLDEPTSGLDPQTARGVRELVLDLRREGRAIVISTHNLDEAERVADRVGVLRQRLIALDSPSALRRRLFGRRIRILLAQPAAGFVAAVRAAGARDVAAEDSCLSVAVEDADVETPGIVRHLVAAGADIRAVAEEQANLEEIYLRLLE